MAITRSRFAGTALLLLISALAATTVTAQTVYTQSTDPNTIVINNGISCGSTAGVSDNQYWRVYDLSALQPGVAFRVEAFRVGIEVSDTVANTFELRVYTQTGGAFPGGTRTLQGATQTIVEPIAGAFNNTIQIMPFATPVSIPANSVLVVEFAVLDNSTLGGRFWPGTNTAGESGPTYLSSLGCGVGTPTTLATLGFPTCHMILDVIGNGPEMDVQRPAATSIIDGGTDNLGNTSTAGQSFTYTIQNSGFANLLFGGTAVTATPVSNCTVSVTTQPAASVPFSGANTTTFVVLVTPTGTVAFSFTISIDSGTSPVLGLDFNEDPYNFTVSGTGVTGPFISVNPGSLALGSTIQGVPSTPSQSYSVSGGNLTADIIITPPAGVEIRTGAAAFANTAITLTQTGGVVAATTIDVRIGVSATTGQAFSPITNASTGATTQNVTLTGTVTAPVPDMAVARGATPIADAGTDALGGIPIVVAQTVTYTVTNNGTLGLNLNGTPVIAISALTNVTSATVTTPPASTSVAPAASVTFTITYVVTTGAAFSFGVSIANDDPGTGKNPYTWTVSGTGTTAPSMNVTRGATPVADGGTSAVGNATFGAATLYTYTITNAGTAALTLTLPVSISGQTNCTVSITTPPSASVGVGLTTTLVLSVTPTAAGVFSFNVSITNDDPGTNKNPYNWTVSGTGTSLGVGGGTGGGGGGGGCSTDSNSAPWFVLFGLLAALVAVGRLRRARQ